MKTFVATALLIALFNCSSNDPKPATADVYFAGYTFNADRVLVAKYWKNGTVISLTDGKANAAATGISVSGNDVFVSGWDLSDNILNAGKYWKNGDRVSIGNDCHGIISIASSNNDIYILEIDNLGWKYRKNDVITVIADSVSGQVTGLAVSGADVYTSGYTGLLTDHFAECWKNGALIYVSNEQSEALAISTNGSDIYLAGYTLSGDGQHKVATYWKNGQPNAITTGQSDAFANSIMIMGTDVYVAGAENGVATYWKNGTSIQLTDGSKTAGALSIAVKGDDIFVAGYDGSNPAFWKNGIAQTFDNSNEDGVIVGIAIK